MPIAIIAVSVLAPYTAPNMIASSSAGNASTRSLTRIWLFDLTTRIGAMFSPTGVADLANTPIGTGPYVGAQRRRGDSIVLRENTAYWGHKPAYHTVYLKYIKDPTALNNALLSNGIDIISTITAPDSIPQFDSDKRFNVVQGTTNSVVTLAFNDARAPLNDVRVRRALTYAIDRKALLDTAWAGRGTLIGSIVPPTDPWYEDLSEVYPFDLARAKALLAEAGIPNPTLRLRIPNLPYAVSAAQVVASQLADVRRAGDDRAAGFPGRLAQAGVHRPRLRPVDHPARRGQGHHDFRQSRLLLGLPQSPREGPARAGGKRLDRAAGRRDAGGGEDHQRRRGRGLVVPVPQRDRGEDQGHRLHQEPGQRVADRLGPATWPARAW
jgi:hypothetical protein